MKYLLAAVQAKVPSWLHASQAAVFVSLLVWAVNQVHTILPGLLGVACMHTQLWLLICVWVCVCLQLVFGSRPPRECFK